MAAALQAFLSVSVAAFSFRFLQWSPNTFAAAPEIMKNKYASSALPVHAGSAALALLIGPAQFITTHGRRARWHRVVGPIYIGACFIAAFSAFFLATGTSYGVFTSSVCICVAGEDESTIVFQVKLRVWDCFCSACAGQSSTCAGSF